MDIIGIKLKMGSLTSNTTGNIKLIQGKTKTTELSVRGVYYIYLFFDLLIRIKSTILCCDGFVS